MSLIDSQKLIEQFAVYSAKQMEQWVQQKYNVPEFKLKIVISFGIRRVRSYGGTKKGRPIVNLVCKRFAYAHLDNALISATEYEHIVNDPIIGALKDVSWQKALLCLIAHEVAHAVQFYPTTKQTAKELLGLQNNHNQDSILLNHNWFWQQIYADLRIQFVNSHTDQSCHYVTKPEKPKKPKQKYNKSWSVIVSKVKQYRYSTYYTSNNVLIGTLCSTSGCIWRYDPHQSENKKYIKLTAKNLVEARRQEFGL